MMRRTYRRVMRKIARYILGFERCPSGCRKNYKAIALELMADVAVTFAAIFLFGLLVINC